MESTITKTHMCISIAGMLAWSPQMWRKNIQFFTHDDGLPMTISEAKKTLEGYQSEGKKVLPLYEGQCDDFDFVEGCRGHIQKEIEN